MSPNVAFVHFRDAKKSSSDFTDADSDLCKDLLVRHGGHAAAAGFTVKNENLPELVSRLKEIAKEQLEGKDLRQTLTADMEVALEELNFDVLKHLAYLEPTGYGNPDAVFVTRDVKVRSARTVGAEGRHLKISLEDSRGAAYDCIGFRLGDLQSSLPPRAPLLGEALGPVWRHLSDRIDAPVVGLHGDFRPRPGIARSGTNLDHLFGDFFRLCQAG